LTTCQAAGVVVVGYVPTGYAATAISSVRAQVDTWKAFYPGIDGEDGNGNAGSRVRAKPSKSNLLCRTGIFWDEMSSTAGNEGYYTQVMCHPLYLEPWSPSTGPLLMTIGISPLRP
jgi:hypothetical protein